MQCRKCGASSANEQRFCGNCGTLLPVICSDCGCSNPISATSCDRCGKSIKAWHASAYLATESDLLDNLAVQSGRSHGEWPEELKQVTVLFADIRNSSGLIDNLNPEQTMLLLDSVVELLSNAIHRFDGFIARIQGDGVMALFGAPMAIEDHALNACCAALTMQEMVSREAPENINIRVGLNSGGVLVRSMDNDLSRDYDAVGSAVHLASQMEQEADPGTVKISNNTYLLAKEYLNVKPLGSTRIKGAQTNIDTYQLEGLVASRTRWDIRATRGLTKLVGRDRETSTLRRVLLEAESGYGQIVTLVGEPGIGKSRLVHELIDSEFSRDWTILKTAASPHAKNTAYFPISRLIRSWYEIDVDDKPDKIIKKINQEIDSLDPNLVGAVPALLSLLDIDIKDEDWEKLDAFQRRRDIIDSFCAVALAMAKTQPVLFVFEDLHWFDTESQAILKSLAESTTSVRMLILGTYRPEHHEGWISNSNVVRLRLGPLDKLNSERLLASLIGNNIDLAPLKRQLIERAGGIPLFLEEMVQGLIETGSIEGQPRNMRLKRDLREITMPATVQSVIAARIDRLAASQKSLLQLASVIGKDIFVPILQKITDIEKSVLMTTLEDLRDSGFLLQTPQSDEYTFKHELTRAVAYESILAKRRRQIHAKIVESIEVLFADRLDEHVDRLADHALRGELWDNAVSFHLQACSRATLRSANREAIALLEGGVRALTKLPASTRREKAAIDLRLMANTAFITLGELEPLIQNLREAESFATGIKDQRRLASVNTWQSIAQWLKGNHEKALEASQAALSIADKIEHPGLQFAARVNLGMAHHGVGNFDQAIGCLDPLHDLLTGDLRLNRAGWAAYPIVMVNTFLASSHIETGNFDSSQELISEASKFADDVNHPYSQAMIRDYQGYLLLSQGSVKQAITVFEDALNLCREYEILNLYRSIAAKLGMAYTRDGRISEAITLYGDVMQPDEYLKGGTYIWLWLYLGLGEAYLADDQYEEALRQVTKGVDLTHSTSEKPHLAYAVKLLGDVHAKQGGGHSQLAEQDYIEALAYAESCSMTPLVAHCHLALGKLFIETDRMADARKALDEAITLYEQVGLTNFCKDARDRVKRLD